ncbi:hypothetical protein PoB_001627400 [Plakobranchus ocellatus]|uniref:Uncharacterized protein n=1 Tax=Plakobranchus ocellatus TaxID=259542 RepID=A0AAV3Z6Z4_9GAST|nr:hypothetical protein PoB_001627400 [Plakobranchus ocellatus]
MLRPHAFLSESGNPNILFYPCREDQTAHVNIDCGVEVYCVDSKVYSKLKNPPKINPKNQHLQGAGGSLLKVLEVARYVVQQNAETSEDLMSLGETTDEEASTSNPDDNAPLSRLSRRAKRQRSSDSSEEENIPEFELRKRLKRREERLAELNSVIRMY